MGDPAAPLIITVCPPALDELSGPRREGSEKVREAGFITGADLLRDGGVTAALRAGELTTP